MRQQTKKRTRETSLKEKPQKKRKRACDRCHRLHKRCDGLYPCANCKHKGIHCSYSENRMDNVFALQQEIIRLKKQLSEYEFAQLQCEIKYSTLVMERNSSLPSTPENYDKFQPLSILYNDTSLYICSLVSRFVNIYYATCYPHHYLTTKNFRDYIPEIYKYTVTHPDEKTEMSFLLFSVIANSAMILGDPRRGEEFYNKALQCAQHLNFEKPSYAVGCACCHLAYQNLCYEKPADAYMFCQIAKNIGEKLNLTKSDLMGEALLRLGFASGCYHEKLKIFGEMWNGNINLTCKLVGVLGSVQTELMMGSNPNFAQLAGMVQKTMAIEPDDWRFLYNLYTNFLLASIYHRAGLKTLAIQAADKILQLAENTELKYVCIIVANAAMAQVADIHLDYGLYDLVDKDLRIIGTFAHYPNGYNTFKRIHKRLMEEQQLTALNLTLDPMTLLDDLEKIYPNQYQRFKDIQEVRKYLIDEEPSPEKFDLEKWKDELDSWLESSQLNKKTELIDQYSQNVACPTFHFLLQ